MRTIRALRSGEQYRGWVCKTHGNTPAVLVIQTIRHPLPAIPVIDALEIAVTRSRMQPGGILWMNRERMGVLWTARNAITPGRPGIVAAYKRSSFDRDMQTISSRQTWKNRLDVMRLWTRWETPCLRRWQCIERVQWIPRLATVVGSIDGAQLRARVDCAVLSGGKCHHVGFLESSQCRPRSPPIFASKHPIAERPAISNTVPVRIDRNALDLKSIQAHLDLPVFPVTCNDRQAMRSGQIKSGLHF